MTSRIQYTADGVETAFPFPFRVFEPTEVAVWVDAGPVDPADYTVAVDPVGGTVTFDTAPAAGAQVTLVGVVVPKRIATYQQSGAFRAQVINAELDRLVAVLAQLVDGQSRRLALPEIDPVAFAALPDRAERADRYLSFDANGQPVARDIVGGVPISSWAIPFVDAADAAAARALLDLAAGAEAVASLGLGAAALEGVAAGGTADLLRADGDGSGLSGIVVDAGLPPGHLTGLTIANNATDAANDIDIAAGSARDGADAADLVLASAITKRLDAAWAAGTDAGGLDTGTVAADTWYAVHLIGDGAGTVDGLFSLSADAPSLPAGFTLARRIGWVLTDGSSAIIPFRQAGERFWWVDPAWDVQSPVWTTTPTDTVISAPPGLPAQFVANAARADTSFHAYLFWTTGTPQPTTRILSVRGAYAYAAVTLTIPTDGQSRISIVAENTNVPSHASLVTTGWLDTRGRDG